MKKKKILGLVFAFLVLLVGGYYWRTQRPGFLSTTRPPTLAPFPPPDWKSYQHPSFGYSLLYPPEWGLREQGAVSDRILDVTSLVVSSDGKRIPVIQIKVSSLPYQEELAKRDIRGSGFGEGRAGEEITVGGREGVKVVSRGEGNEKIISVFLPGQDRTFIFLGSPEAFPGQDQTTLIDQVFSTFKLP